MAKHPSGKRGHARRVFAWVALGWAPAVAADAAKEMPDVANPDQFQCVGRNRFSGVANVPVEKQGENVSWSYAAFFVDPVLGTPTIIYGPRFRELGPLTQGFIRRHECQHANGVQDEIAANCAALAQMQGMSQVAKEAGSSRQSLYRALSADGNPSFATVLKVARALGVRLRAGVV